MNKVTREEFEKITCNRCGDCCESFYLSEEIIGGNWVPIDGEKTLQWLKEVIPIGPIEEAKDKEGKVYWSGRKYKCPRFKREEDGTGTCTQHENRSHICSMFPYGKPKTEYSRCSWNVEIIDSWETEH